MIRFALKAIGVIASMQISLCEASQLPGVVGEEQEVDEVDEVVRRMVALSREVDAELDEREGALEQIESAQSFLKISITRKDQKHLDKKFRKWWRSANRYRVDPEIKERVQIHMDKFYKSREWQNLTDYYYSHQPYNNNETRRIFKNISIQWDRVRDAYDEIDRHDQNKFTRDFSGYVVKRENTIRNQDYEKFDEEYGKLLKCRKELVRSKWGQELKARLEDMRSSDEFKNLEADWKRQVKYERHVDEVEKWNDFIDAFISDWKFTERPEHFEDGHFIRQLVKLLDFISEIDQGELKGFFDYILDEDSLADE